MEYAAVVTKEGKSRLVEFPDCPGCVTQADPGEDAEQMAREALEGWLETHLQRGGVAPVPHAHPRGALMVSIGAALGLKVLFRYLRAERNWTQQQLADRMGVSQPMVAKLEDPDAPNMGIVTIEKVCDALGVRFITGVETPRKKIA